MAGFRNILVHEYSKVNPEIVFGILKKRLPDLRFFAERIAGLLPTDSGVPPVFGQEE